MNVKILIVATYKSDVGSCNTFFSIKFLLLEMWVSEKRFLEVILLNISKTF